MSKFVSYLFDVGYGVAWYFILKSEHAPHWAALAFAVVLFYLFRIRSTQNGI
jgi:hypothetical protein